MKLSLNWIKDYVQLPEINFDELVSKITLSICEVENYNPTGQDLDKVLAAEVIKIEPHPNADKLCLVTVNTNPEQYKVICGAKNFKVGDKVPYAPLNTQLIDFKVKKAKIRGIESDGVLCAEDELGFGEEHSGLMILDSKITVGTSLEKIYPDQVDLILDIDNKSINHRPDLWGHYGFARELSVLFETKFKPFVIDKQILQNSNQSDFSIKIECTDLVPRFCALSLTNLKASNSPDWIRYRLTRVGLRAINSLVDVTNYVMLDLGQPMHIFDRDKLKSAQLVVKKAKTAEKLVTLSEKEIVLCDKDIIITDGVQPVSLAGVVGGFASGVQNNTQNALLEAACWHPSTIRKTSTRVKHRTDASLRYEKSLDPNLTEMGILQAVKILKLSNPQLKIEGELIDLWAMDKKSITIKFNHQQCNSILSLKIPTKKIEQILVMLGFKISKKNDFWKVEVPSWRATRDILIAEDLIEEVGRFYGYDKIEPKVPFFSVIKTPINYQRKFERRAKQILVDRGYFEIMTYPLTNDTKEKEWINNNEITKKLINPLSEEENRMRLSLLPQIVDSVSNNIKEYSNFKLFEIGRLYNWYQQKPQEKQASCLVEYNEKDTINKLFQSAKENCYIWVKKLIQKSIFFKQLTKKQQKYVHKYANCEIFIDENYLGRIFSITPIKKNELNWKGNAIFVELDFDLLFSQWTKKETNLFQELDKFPAAKFEISLVVPLKTYFSELENIANSVEMVEKVEFKYDYLLPNEKDKKSITLSLVFRSNKDTIKAEELINLQDKLILLYEKKGFFLRR